MIDLPASPESPDVELGRINPHNQENNLFKHLKIKNKIKKNSKILKNL